MKIPNLVLSFGLAAISLATAQTTLVEDSFTYEDGGLTGLDGGSGWNSLEGGWQVGNSVAESNRFDIVTGAALYQGGEVGTNTEQNRSFATPVAASTTESIEISFTLLRPEAQAGRGIGIYLTSGGANKLFIGKKVNGGVGLHAGMPSASSTFAAFASASEAITASISFDGVTTSVTLSDSDETLDPVLISGALPIDGISLAGYNGATTTNGIDDILVASIPNPDPWLQVSDLVTFDSNGAPTSFTIPVFNAGADEALSISAISATGQDKDDVSDIAFPASIPPLSEGNITFTFSPSFGPGFYIFDLEVTSNDASAPSPLFIQVEFNVADPVITVETTEIDFGSFPNNPSAQIQTFDVTNNGGSESLEIFEVEVIGSPVFAVTSAPESIAPGATATIEVTFDPGTRPGTHSATLSIISNDANNTTPEVQLLASTELGGTTLADYNFGSAAPLDLTSSDTATSSVASILVETDNGSRAEFGLLANSSNNSAIVGNAFGWSRREAPNNGLNLSSDAPTEALQFTLTPGAEIDYSSDGWLLVDLGAFSGLSGATAYDFFLTVDDGTSPFTVGPVAGASVSGSGQDSNNLVFDIRSLGNSVAGPVSFTLMPQTTGNTNGVISQAGGYVDNIIVTASEVVPLSPLLLATSPTILDDEGLGGVKSFPITNVGGAPLNISSVTTDGSGNSATISNITFSSPLAVGESGTIDFDFTPNAGAGLYTTNLTVVSDDPGSPTTIALEITVNDPEILVLNPTANFGPLPNNPGPQVMNVSVTNDGEADLLTISGTTLSGNPAFSVTSLPEPIAPGESGDIEVTFAPLLADGFFNATFTIQSNDINGTEPVITLSAYVASDGVVVGFFDFDPNQVSLTTVDLDGSAMTEWSTSALVDQATGVSNTYLGDNQNNNNRGLATGVSGNYLQLGGNRESDAQTPLEPGGENESTWTRFTITPGLGGGTIDFTNGTAETETYANSDLGNTSTADWTLYYSTDSGSTWNTLGTFAGASTISGTAEPLALSWDLTPIGVQTVPVDFIIDPVNNTGNTNGSRTQRGVGFDNFVLTASSVTTGSSGFSSWASDYGIVNNPEGDTDGDGIVELVEYALGLNPTVPDSSPGTFENNVLSYTKGADAVANGDIEYTIETSTDLGALDPWTPVEPDTNDDTIISYTLPGDQGKIFARLSITQAL